MCNVYAWNANIDGYNFHFADKKNRPVLGMLISTSMIGIVDSDLVEA